MILKRTVATMVPSRAAKKVPIHMPPSMTTARGGVQVQVAKSLSDDKHM